MTTKNSKTLKFYKIKAATIRKILHFTFCILHCRNVQMSGVICPARRLSARGQSVLAFILLFGSIITIAGLTMAFLAESFLGSTAGFRASEEARALASSGAYDAMMRLSRAKDLSGTYSIPIDGRSINVTVTPDSPSSGLVTIVANATVQMRERAVRVVVSRNATTGAIELVSWNQL